MNLLDIILLIFAGAFALFGFWFGTIHALGSLVGMIIATFVASRIQEPITNWIAGVTGNPFVVKIIVFFLIYFIISKLVGFVFMFIEKPMNLLTHLPFIHSIDRLIGALIGLVEGVLIVGAALFILTRSEVPPQVAQQLTTSQMVPWFLGVSFILQPLIPESIKKIQSLIRS